MKSARLKLILLLLTGLFFLAAGTLATVKIQTCLTAPIPLKAPGITLTIAPGQGLNRITATLAEKGVIRHPTLFKLYARYQRAATRIKAGEYQFSGPTTLKKVLEQLTAGRVKRYRLTIPEGLNMAETAHRVAALGGCKESRFLALCQDPVFVASLKIPALSLEGYLFPDTYFFPAHTPCKKIIQAMVSTFYKTFTPKWRARAKALGFTVHEVVTLASIIEKETGNARERPLIASVFHNRLKKKMRLESDPTVIYGDKTFKGRIRKRHLLRVTPYNTYQIPGLPRGPIANPGALSIEAALYPAQTDYLFFVSKNDTTHQFSRTLKAHNRAVRKYQLNR